jgi:type IV pilus assembly protein PilO
MEQLIDKYSKVPPKHRLGAAIAIVIALIAGHITFVQEAQSTLLVQKKAVYKAKEAERAEKQAYVDNLAKYAARLSELQQDLNRARAQLPDKPNVAEFLAQLSNRGRQSGLSINTFKPLGESKRDPYAEIGFDLSVRGSYHEIATFIDSLAKLDRIVNVSNISMTTPKTENKKIVVSGKFAVKTYRFIDANKEKKKKKE